MIINVTQNVSHIEELSTLITLMILKYTLKENGTLPNHIHSQSLVTLITCMNPVDEGVGSKD